jgi:predicted RNA-binding Zn-ribbon protein involved in translation (DUF1610 family)
VFNAQQLISALDSKGASRKCPSCGSQAWSTHGDVHVPARDPADVFQAYMLICEACGFIRLHAAQALEG